MHLIRSRVDGFWFHVGIEPVALVLLAHGLQVELQEHA